MLHQQMYGLSGSTAAHKSTMVRVYDLSTEMMKPLMRPMIAHVPRNMDSRLALITIRAKMGYPVAYKPPVVNVWSPQVLGPGPKKLLSKGMLSR